MVDLTLLKEHNPRLNLIAIRKLLMWVGTIENGSNKFDNRLINPFDDCTSFNAILTGGWLRDYYSLLKNHHFDYSFNDFDICIRNVYLLDLLHEELIKYPFVRLIKKVESIIDYYGQHKNYKYTYKIYDKIIDIWVASFVNFEKTLQGFDFKENTLYMDEIGIITELFANTKFFIEKGTMRINNNNNRLNFDERLKNFKNRGWNIKNY